MKTFLCRLWAALAVVGCGAASVLGSDAAPAPAAAAVNPAAALQPLPPASTPVAPAPTPVASPSSPPAPTPEPAKSDTPLDLPGLPPLPAMPEGAAGNAAAPTSEASDAPPWGRFFVDAEYLYLRPYRRDLNFAIVSAGGNGTPQGSIQSDPWHSRSAFRVGAGWSLPADGWDVGFYYTYLHNDETGFLTRPAGGLLFATLTHPGTVEFVQSASADANINYNVFDLEAGRRLCVGESLSLRPFGGLRFADITQTLNVLYDGGDANKDMVGSRIKFTGAGLRAGGQADWKVLDHVSLYGRAAGSLMTGDFNVHQTEFNNAGATPLTNVSESFRKIVPVMELGVGVAYLTEHVRLSVGYEMTNWFGLIDAPSFVSDVQQGKFQRDVSDLGVDGLAVRAEFTY